jgi:hypothetical protein
MKRKQFTYWLVIAVSVATLITFMVGWAKSVDYNRLGVDQTEVVNAGSELRDHPGCEQECAREALKSCVESKAVCDQYLEIQAAIGSCDDGYVACERAIQECERANERCMMLCKRVK